MKFNPKSLKSLFKAIRQSPIDDMAVNAVKNNADNIAMGALDVVDDIPTSVSLDDITDAYKNRIPVDKTPITTDEFVANYKAQMPAKYETRQMLDLFPEQYANAPSELDLLNMPISEDFDNFKLDNTPTTML